MKDTVRLNFDFPRSEYPYLKLICAEMGISFKEFATELLLKTIEEYEDKKLARRARKRLKDLDPKDNIPFKKAMKEVQWDDCD